MMPRDPEQPDFNVPEITEGAAAAEKEKAAEYLAAWQRTQADFLNFKRRTEQDRQEFCSFANAGLIQAMLPVLDDLDRALAAEPPDLAGHDWVEGIRAVARKFRASMEAQGVKAIMTLGMAFDPNLHEAIRQEKGKEGVVMAEYQKGYTLNGKLLRPARVAVGSGEEDDVHESDDVITSF
jgi:molecular chaperone GrpE